MLPRPSSPGCPGSREKAAKVRAEVRPTGTSVAAPWNLHRALLHRLHRAPKAGDELAHQLPSVHRNVQPRGPRAAHGAVVPARPGHRRLARAQAPAAAQRRRARPYRRPRTLAPSPCCQSPAIPAGEGGWGCAGVGDLDAQCNRPRCRAHNARRHLGRDARRERAGRPMESESCPAKSDRAVRSRGSSSVGAGLSKSLSLINSAALAPSSSSTPPSTSSSSSSAPSPAAATTTSEEPAATSKRIVSTTSEESANPSKRVVSTSPAQLVFACFTRSQLRSCRENEYGPGTSEATIRRW